MFFVTYIKRKNTLKLKGQRRPASSKRLLYIITQEISYLSLSGK